MPLAPAFGGVVAVTRRLPTPVRYAAAVGIVAAVFAVRGIADPWLPRGYPFLLPLLAVLLCAALFNHGSGLLATTLSAALADYFYLPPAGSLAVADARDINGLVMFSVVGVVATAVVETLHRALAELQRAHADLRRSERARALLLREFRHRTRNDLGSLVGLLLLRARGAPSEAARDGLREAAQHAMALARVHARLAPREDAAGSADEGVEAMGAVDTRDFVSGLCADIEAALLGGEGLRAVTIRAEAEAHVLDAERAVPLGLVLNEALTNALKHAFPDDRAGTVRVRLVREDAVFVLTVADDGVGLPAEGDLDGAPPAAPPPGAGLGTRLLRALAAQLRGSFSRRPGEGGVGTVSELRFPAAPPR